MAIYSSKPFVSSVQPAKPRVSNSLQLFLGQMLSSFNSCRPSLQQCCPYRLAQGWAVWAVDRCQQYQSCQDHSHWQLLHMAHKAQLVPPHILLCLEAAVQLQNLSRIRRTSQLLFCRHPSLMSLTSGKQGVLPYRLHLPAHS